MAYDVHICTVVRVKIPNIEAATPKEAISAAKESVDFDVMFNGRGRIRGETEWAEEDSHYIVDVVIDEEYELTQSFLDATHVGYVQKMLEDGVDQV